MKTNTDEVQDLDEVATIEELDEVAEVFGSTREQYIIIHGRTYQTMFATEVNS